MCPDSRKIEKLMYNISGDVRTLLRFPAMILLLLLMLLLLMISSFYPLTSSSLTGLLMVLKGPQAYPYLRTFAHAIPSVWSSFPCIPVPLTHSHHCSAAFPDHSTQWRLQGPTSGHLVAMLSFISFVTVFANTTTPYLPRSSTGMSAS